MESDRDYDFFFHGTHGKHDAAAPMRARLATTPKNSRPVHTIDMSGYGETKQVSRSPNRPMFFI